MANFTYCRIRLLKILKEKKMASNIRIKIGLKCSESGDINYTTTKNSKKTTDKIELKKYCPRLKKHTVHKETKLK